MKILAFDSDNLAESLSNEFTYPEVIKTKNHFTYFMQYLGKGLKAQSIVIEDQYVSKDFLQDYASYYALCFANYPKYCKRIHFFNTTLTEELLNKAILNKQEGPFDLWKNYLGFIVVKPIPTTIIGYTVLKDYNSATPWDGRHFWGLRDYKVHIFGREETIKSLAFQEQDSVLSACATTAIWSMLNKAAMDFHTILKSPSQITRDADNMSPDGSRLFPNKGLSVLQICQAIFNSGLVSEVKQPDSIETDDKGSITGYYVSNNYTRKIINAYASIGIPIILVISVPEGERYGLHAITVTGYKINEAKPEIPKEEISWCAANIDRLYAHDDQWGPFVRVTLQNELDLETMWTEKHIGKLPTKVTNIIVPLYLKIRISYEDIEAIVIGIDRILTWFFKNLNKFDLVWDIKIELSENFKSNLAREAIDDVIKLAYLTASMPKYLWIATCYIGTFKVFEFTFDATDVNSGMIGKDLICYLPDDQRKILHQFLVKNETILKSVSSKRARLHYFNFLKKKLA